MVQRRLWLRQQRWRPRRLQLVATVAQLPELRLVVLAVPGVSVAGVLKVERGGEQGEEMAEAWPSRRSVDFVCNLIMSAVVVGKREHPKSSVSSSDTTSISMLQVNFPLYIRHYRRWCPAHPSPRPCFRRARLCVDCRFRRISSEARYPLRLQIH